MSKKLAKEAFVQGHTGTSVAEINVISTIPVLVSLICMLLSVGKVKKKSLREFSLESFSLVAPLVVTLMGPASPAIVLGTLLLVTIALLVIRKQRISQLWNKKINVVSTGQALSMHRACVQMITCVAILAVDFHAFPRRLAKAETFGTGFMDAGVGSIVVGTAFASSARAHHRSSRPTPGSFKRNMLRLAALIALGVGRTAATTAVDYQTHVGEYGVHWNFFLTLAALRAVTLAVPAEVNASAAACGILGAGLLATHQMMLSLGGMNEFIHEKNIARTNLLSANKEGIFSLPGYIALHFLGCACGALFEQTTAPRVSRTRQRRQIIGVIAGLWAGLYLVTWMVEPVSRRSCNAAYVLWMLALNAQSLALLAVCTALAAGRPTPWLLEAINEYQLHTFLVANVCTGLVNLAIDTMAVGDWTARGIVGVYMVVVCAAAVGIQQLLRKGDTFNKRRRSLR